MIADVFVRTFRISVSTSTTVGPAVQFAVPFLTSITPRGTPAGAMSRDAGYGISTNGVLLHPAKNLWFGLSQNIRRVNGTPTWTKPISPLDPATKISSNAKQSGLRQRDTA